MAAGGIGHRLTGALLRQVGGAVGEAALRGGDRFRRGGHALGRGARRRAQLFARRQAQRDLPALALVRRRRVVPRLDAKPQRVAGKQAALLGVQLALDDGAILRRADV